MTNLQLRSGLASLLLALATSGTSACLSNPRPQDGSVGVDADAGPSDSEDAGSSERMVAPGVWELADLDITTPPGDLAPLEGIIDGAQVVALGETIHFSNGYHEARARVIKHLIEDLGFRAVAYEGMWGDSIATKAYVEAGTGTLDQAMNGLSFFAWFSESSAWLLQWLREWNELHPDDPVRIFGFDVQDPRHDGIWLSEFLTGANAEETTTIVDDLSHCIGVDMTPDAYWTLQGELCDGSITYPEADDLSCLEGIEAAASWIDENEESLSETQGDEALALARVAARALLAGHEEFRDCTDYVLSSNHRDHGMADTFESLKSLWAPQADTVIFAHNLHIATNGEDLDANGYEWKGMGSWLGERLGDDYAAIGLFASEVRANWPGAGEVYELRYDAATAVESALAVLGDLLLVDLDAATQPGGPLTAETSYDMANDRGVPRSHYRALIYMNESPEMKYYKDVGP